MHKEEVKVIFLFLSYLRYTGPSPSEWNCSINSYFFASQLLLLSLCMPLGIGLKVVQGGIECGGLEISLVVGKYLNVAPVQRRSGCKRV